ncbi:hypothetical protein CAL19_06595 [Bordetella genomosp. 7]|uniref:HTH lysR-type domain-containing protein n=1 Tax=Bordetella genomosp. 7 TaxID=1416805 RepID=A0A261RKD6_9BORD|nr:hypothetical protein CAL19_06595 [Bordetella genomosp. 7]
MLARIQLRHLEAFHAVMVSGSITGAAHLLHVTQPAISATIKHFEQRLGFTLFRREGAALRLPPRPGRCCPKCRKSSAAWRAWSVSARIWPKACRAPWPSPPVRPLRTHGWRRPWPSSSGRGHRQGFPCSRWIRI